MQIILQNTNDFEKYLHFLSQKAPFSRYVLIFRFSLFINYRADSSQFMV